MIEHSDPEVFAVASIAIGPDGTVYAVTKGDRSRVIRYDPHGLGWVALPMDNLSTTRLSRVGDQRVEG